MPPKKVAGAGAGAAKKKGAKAGGYQMPEPLPAGSVLTDLCKQQWKIGPSIGTGGFGEIYSACRAGTAAPKRTEDYPFVVKIEPHNNGPLFVEMHFYMRNAKQDDIETFRKSKRLASLGMPHFVGNGSHELNSIKHRFVVMPRYGKDIAKCWLESGKRLPPHTAYRLALQMLDVLEYIHQCTYVHADLKGANMLLGQGKAGAGQAYLVDFGLACHYTTAPEFKPDPKKMHNGTIEYTSRDAHCGVPTRRGDLEILAYNLVHWWGVELPWERAKLLGNPVKVHEAKKAFMGDVEKGLRSLLDSCPAPIVQFFKYVTTLAFNDAPDYAKCRKIFEAGLKALGKPNSGDLDFKTTSVTAARKPDIDEARPSPSPSPKKPVKKATGRAKPKPAVLSSEDESNYIPPPPKKAVASKRNGQARLDDTYDSDSSLEVLPAKKSRTKSSQKPTIAEKENASTNGTSKTTTSATTGSSSSTTTTGGSMTINNDIQSKGRKKRDKTYEFNFELDVSLDADVVINVKRKPRKDAVGTPGSAKKASTPLQKVLSGSVASAMAKAAAAQPDDESDVEEIEASPDVTPVASMRVLHKDSSRRQKAGGGVGTPTTRKSPRN